MSRLVRMLLRMQRAPEEAFAGADFAIQADAIAGPRTLCKQLCEPLGGSLRRCDHFELV